MTRDQLNAIHVVLIGVAITASIAGVIGAYTGYSIQCRAAYGRPAAPVETYCGPASFVTDAKRLPDGSTLCTCAKEAP